MVKKLFSSELSGIIVRSVLLFAVLYLVSLSYYTPVVDLVQLVTVFMAISVFVVTWNSQRFITNHAFLILGVGYLFVGLFDLQSFIARESLTFSPMIDHNEAQQMWWIGKLIGCTTFFIAPFFARKKVNANRLLWLYSIIAILFILSVYVWKIFPVCYVEGQGTTPFARGIGIYVTGVFLASIYLYLSKRNEFDPDVFPLLLATPIIRAPLNFLIAIREPNTFEYFLSLFLHLVGFYILYVAIVEFSLSKPQKYLFKALEESEEVKKQRDFLQLLFSAETDAIIVFDKKTGCISEANSAACRMFGYSQDELLQLAIDDLRANPEETSRIVSDALDHNVSHLPKVIDKKKDGTTFPAAVSLGTFQVGKHTMVCEMIRDITEQERLRQDLVNKNRELTDFAYRVSHDLKAPLNIIIGYLSILKEDPSQVETVLTAVNSQSELMKDLIDSILKLSRAGKTIEIRENVSLAEILEDAFNLLQIKDISVRFQVNGTAVINGDPDQLRQAFMNLFINSIEHRDPEKPELIIEVDCVKKDNHYLIRVSDNGSGIKSEILDKIFELGFSRKERGQRGTGFGLAIVQRIIEAHGGRIWVESAGPGQGATFNIELPG